MKMYLGAAPNKPPPRLGARYTIEVKGLWKIEILGASGGSKIRFCAAVGAQNPPKTHPKSSKNLWKSNLGGFWGPWSPKTPKRPPTWSKSTPHDPPILEAKIHQNSPKIGPKPIQNAILFLIGSWIHFKRILVPNWLQLGSQNPPKMEPSWVRNRCELEHSFGSYFWMDVG